ncbi:hypothetical protein EYF80_004996 [Liparis tanakae]|uniref:Uncharacterized protein n=1 Tax=Liparis tanakae TaxID=230148 RepID=A0A4Z2J4S7_9TELE|nr:hypothetical protein EYF80_004996 [Liparis tanakae]
MPLPPFPRTHELMLPGRLPRGGGGGGMRMHSSGEQIEEPPGLLGNSEEHLQADTTIPERLTFNGLLGLKVTGRRAKRTTFRLFILGALGAIKGATPSVQVERDEDEDGFVALIARRRRHLEAATTFRRISHVDFCRLEKIREAPGAMAAAAC